VWRVDSEEVLRTARQHFAQGLLHCGCTGMALSEADVTRRGLQVIR
jgi:hypothetical protein